MDTIFLKIFLVMITTEYVDIAFGCVTIYPHPWHMEPSDKFEVYIIQNHNRWNSFTYINRVDHRIGYQKRTYKHRTVSWTAFAFSGDPVTVEVRTKRDFNNCVVRPTHYDYTCTRTTQRTARFNVTSNTQMMSVEFDYDNGTGRTDIKDKLLIFADAPETHVPDPDSSGLLYFGPGETNLHGQMIINSSINEIYLAPGAYVHGGFRTTGNQSVKLYGRGVLSGEKFKFKDIRFEHAMIQMDEGSNHTVEGLVLVDPPRFFLRLLSDYGTVTNVKTLGVWTYNTDGVVIGENGIVQDSFFMANDDAIKLYHSNVVIKKCVVWQSYNGAVFQTGWWENRTIHHVRVSDIDVIHTDWCAFMPNKCKLSPNNAILSQTGKKVKKIEASDIQLKDIRIEGGVPRLLSFIVKEGATGYVANFSFVNWTVERLSHPEIKSKITGSKQVHVNLWHFENIRIGGICVSNASSANVILDEKTVFGTSFHCPIQAASNKANN